MTGWVAPSAVAVPQRNWQRATGAALVLLLHALVLLAVLRAITQPMGKGRLEHEMTLILPRLLRPTPKPQMTPQPPSAPSPRAITLPPPVIIPPLSTPTPDIKALGQSLFGCAPENLGNLSPERRARCGGSGISRGDGRALTEPPSHVKNPELRAAEMDKRNTPLTVPCVSIQTQSLGNNAEQQVFVVDPLCATRELNR